jgi:glutathione synthase/RimK-type ligase-like ATP-grasp enzyme
LSKVVVIRKSHELSLLALHQEFLGVGIDTVSISINKLDSDDIVALSGISSKDVVFLLSTELPSLRLPEVVGHANCRYFYNEKPFRYERIGDKRYQQDAAARVAPQYAIETHAIGDVDGSRVVYPVLAKPPDGTCGRGVRLIETEADFQRARNSSLIVQPFIRNDGDWRVVVIDGKAVSAIKRVGQVGKVTNNIATGSYAIAERDPAVLERVFEVAEAAASALEFDYVGIDVIRDLDNGGFYFLEANERATFETSQLLTGVNIARILSRSILARM